MRLLHSVLAVYCTVSSAWAAENAFFGTWKLIPEKSKFTPATSAPKRLTLTFQPDGEKVRLIVNGIDGEGKPVQDENSLPWDGQFHPTQGGPMGPGRVAVKRVNDRSNHVTMEVGGKTVLTIKSVLSKDGKTMTNTGDGVSPKGEKIHYVEILEKQ